MRSWTGHGTLVEVRDWSGDPQRGSGRVKRPSRSFRDGSSYPQSGLGLVKGPLGRSGTGRGTSLRSGTGQGALEEVQGTHEEVQGTHGEVRDGRCTLV